MANTVFWSVEFGGFCQAFWNSPTSMGFPKVSETGGPKSRSFSEDVHDIGVTIAENA